MVKRIAPTFRPGPLSRSDAESLSQLARDLYSMFGAIGGVAPIDVRQGAGGVSIAINPTALSSMLEPQLDYTDSTLNFVNDILNYDDLTIVNYAGATINVTQNSIANINGGDTWEIAGPGLFLLTAPVEICGYQFWCCADVTFPSPPLAPTLGQTPGGAIAATVYYVRSTYVTPSGESAPSSETAGSIAANNLLVATTPAAGYGASGWNVYVSTTTGTETKQNATPIAIGTNWTEPATGLIAGTTPPTGLFVNDWVLPTAATVYDIASAINDVNLSGIVPALLGNALNTGDITAATNAAPIVLTVPGWTTAPTVGQAVCVSGVKGNLAANGTFLVQAVTATTLTLKGSTGTGAFAASVGSTVTLTGPQIVALTNVAANRLIISSESSSSQQGHRVALPPVYGGSVILEQNDSIVLWFDACTDAAWKVLSCTVSNSGGVNLQTGTTYTFVQSDLGKLVSFSNASAIAATLPQAGISGNFTALWFMDVENRGAGTLTITPTTSTIDGAASLAIPTNQGVRIFSDGTNYYTQRGMASGVPSLASGSQIITSAMLLSSSWQTAPLAGISLGSGTYLLTAQVVGDLTTTVVSSSFTTPSAIFARLWDVSNSAAIGNSVWFCACSVANVRVFDTCTVSAIFTTTGTSISFQALCPDSNANGAVQTGSTENINSCISYIQLS